MQFISYMLIPTLGYLLGDKVWDVIHQGIMPCLCSQLLDIINMFFNILFGKINFPMQGLVFGLATAHRIFTSRTKTMLS